MGVQFRINILGSRPAWQKFLFTDYKLLSVQTITPVFYGATEHNSENTTGEFSSAPSVHRDSAVVVFGLSNSEHSTQSETLVQTSQSEHSTSIQ